MDTELILKKLEIKTLGLQGRVGDFKFNHIYVHSITGEVTIMNCDTPNTCSRPLVLVQGSQIHSILHKDGIIKGEKLK